MIVHSYLEVWSYESIVGRRMDLQVTKTNIVCRFSLYIQKNKFSQYLCSFHKINNTGYIIVKVYTSVVLL